MEVTAKNEERELDDIYRNLKQSLKFYPWRGNVFYELEMARLNCWEKMIKTESLEKKIRGINNIKKYFDQLSVEENTLSASLKQAETWVENSKVI